MEGLVLRTGLSAIVDKPNRQRAIHDASRFKFTFRRAILVDPRRVSLRRTLDQILSPLSGACFHSILSVRSDSAPKDSSLSISHGRCRALFVLPAAAIDFGIYRIQLGLSDCGGGLDCADHVVLQLLSRRRCAHLNDRRRAGWRLSVSLHHFATTGLRTAHG